MKKWLFLIVSVPTSVFALSYDRSSLLYTDAPFRPADAAGVSILTSLKAVQGYPDGSFRPERTLNRAEFLKIALASHPTIRVSSSDAARCFPDVSKQAWFSPYVCLAKKRGIISGYPDGSFKPESPVNYAEALKILGELYEYTAYADENAEWWQVYVQAAINHKTILPVQLTYDRLITRGQMTRLAAAYRAEYEDELGLYRRMEAGEDVIAFLHTQSLSSLSSEALAKEDSLSSSSSSSAPLVRYETPVKSQILLIGKEHAIADALLYTQQRDAHLRILKIKLDREARAVKQLKLRDTDGVQITTLKLDLNDRDNETWIATLDGGTGSYVFPGGEGTHVVVVADLKDWNGGGFSDDYFKVKSMFVMVEKANNPAETYQIIPTSANYPTHQTAMAEVTSVMSALTGTGQLVSGNEQQLAAFDFDGETVGGISDLWIEHLRFHIDAGEDVGIDDPYIKSGSSQKYSCSRESGDPSIVNCLNIPTTIGNVDGSRVIEFYADVNADEAVVGSSLQINLTTPGSRSESGDVRFTDASASFTWIEGDSPLAEGKKWVK